MTAIGIDAMYRCPNPVLVVAGERDGALQLGVWVLFAGELFPLASAGESI